MDSTTKKAVQEAFHDVFGWKALLYDLLTFGVIIVTIGVIINYT